MSLLRVKHGGQPLNSHALEQWLQSSRGRNLLALEQQEVQRLLPDVFGRHLLQVGCWGVGDQLITSAETLHHAVMGTLAVEGTAALIDPENLPLASRSVDAVLLPHTLEFVRSPHNVLREVNRVLNDRGRLFILGFNPWGGWALRGRLGFRYHAFPQGARFTSARRLCDWMELLDLEVTEVRRFGIGFPWTAPHTVGEPWNLASLVAPFSEAYLLSARKRVLPMNFIRRAQRAQIKPLVGVPMPSARSETSGSSLFEKSDP